MRRAFAILAAALFFGSCGSSSSPAGPSSTSSTTNTVATTFAVTGTVTSTSGIGPVSGATVRVNDGVNAGRSTTTASNGTYTISGLAVSGFNLVISKAGYGDAAVGVNLSSNQTANAQLPPLPPFTRSGSGDTVLDIPDYVAQLRITGTYTGSSSNFIIWFGPHNVACESTINAGCHLLVNEIIGTFVGRTSYTGTILTGAGGTASIDTASVSHSSGVSWSLTEISSR